MQQVDFDAAMIEERDEAITDIASAIMEVSITIYFFIIDTIRCETTMYSYF